MGVNVSVIVAVNVSVGRGVRVGDAVRVGIGVRVGVVVAVNLGSRVDVEVSVSVAVEVGVREGVRVAVFVCVGVLDNAAFATCAPSVPKASVARALKFAVGDGFLGVAEAVTVWVAVRAGMNVRVTVAPSVGAWPGFPVCVKVETGEGKVSSGLGVAVGKSKCSDEEKGLAVCTTTA